jgi:hypothetical protein
LEIKGGQGNQSIYFIGALNSVQHEAIKKCGFVDEVEPDGRRFGDSPSLSSDMQNSSIKA